MYRLAARSPSFQFGNGRLQYCHSWPRGLSCTPPPGCTVLELLFGRSRGERWGPPGQLIGASPATSRDSLISFPANFPTGIVYGNSMNFRLSVVTSVTL